MYDELVAWIDEALAKGMPESAVAACFNIYEDGDNCWSLVTGTGWMQLF